MRQAGGLFPGGLAVLGLFVFGPGGLPAPGSSPLLESLAGAWASGWSGGAKGSPTPPPPCLVVGWCAESRRVGSRELVWPEKEPSSLPLQKGDGAVASAAAAAAALAASVAAAAIPASLRFTPLVGSLVLAQAAFPLRTCPPVRSDGGSDGKVAAALQRALRAAGDRAAASLALIAGEPVRPSETVGECVGRVGLGQGRRLVVEVAPPPACLVGEEDGENDADADALPSPGTVTLTGTVTALALATPRDTLESLVEALVADLRRSLSLRLAAAVREAEDAEADAAIAAAVPGGFSASAAADEAAQAAGADGLPIPAGCCGPSGAGAPGVPGWEVTPPLLRHPAALGGGAGGALPTPLGRRGLAVDCDALLPGISDLALPGTAEEAADDAAAVVEGVLQLVLGGSSSAAAPAVEWLEAPPADAGPAGVLGSGVGAPVGKRMALSLEDGASFACPMVWVVVGGAGVVAALAAGVAWLSL